MIDLTRPRQSGCRVAQLKRHLDHCPPEPYAREETLRRLVLLGGREHHARHAARPEELKRGLEEQASDASTAMFRVNDDVVQDARRTAKHHVVVALDGCVRVANHNPVVTGDEDSFVLIFKLSADEGRIAFWRPWPRSQEALWVEVVMLLDEERAEASDLRQVGGGRAPDEWHGLESELIIFALQRLRSILRKDAELRTLPSHVRSYNY